MKSDLAGRPLTGNRMEKTLLRYDLGKGAVAFSTRRQGGAGQGTYASFNINPYCGDAPEHVRANRGLLCGMLGLADDRLVFPHQMHTANIYCIDGAFMTGGDDVRRAVLEGVDALVTDLPELCIGVSTADCIPVLLYDPVRNVGAAIHAGWRGTVARIAERTVEVMKARYGCTAGQLRCAIGPGISLDAFEVGDEVYDTFRTAGFPMERLARRYPATCVSKWHIDLWEANRLQLMDAGVPDSQIQVAGICTYACHADYFSARRLGIASGRIFSGILLRS